MSSGWKQRVEAMQLQPGHAEDSRIVHLTHTSLVVEALCGEDIRFHGEPDVAVICVECLEFADSHGIDATAWSRETLVTVRLPLAA